MVNLLHNVETDTTSCADSIKIDCGDYISIVSETYRSLINAPFCLSDAIAEGLVDQNGRVYDRRTGAKHRLDTALSIELISSKWREVVDIKECRQVTIETAIASKILNIKAGKFVNNVTNEKLTFHEAYDRKFICKPITLRDAIDLGMYDEATNKISSAVNTEKLSISEAIDAGVLDVFNLQCICVKKDGHDKDMTLGQAIAWGFFRQSDGMLLHKDKQLPIKEAIDLGLITSVQRKSLFNLNCFKDTCAKNGCFISFNKALERDILIWKNNKFFMDDGNGNLLELDHGLQAGLINKDVFTMFNRKVLTGDTFEKLKKLSVINLIGLDLFDPRTFYLLDPETKSQISFANVVKSLKLFKNVSCFKDTLAKNDCFISFNEALERDILIWKNNKFLMDGGNGDLLELDHCIQVGLINKEVFTMFNRKVLTGDTSEKFKTLTVIDLIGLDLFEPSTGYLLDPETKTQIPFAKAVELKLISEDDSELLESLLSIIVTTKTVGTLKKNNACTPDVHTDFACSKVGLTFAEAVELACFDETRQRFKHPQTGQIFSIEDALYHGFLKPDCDNSLTGIQNQDNRDLPDNKGPGNLYIFNNDNFYGSARIEALNNREGSKFDVQNLKKTFGKYDVNVSEYNNLTVDGIKTEITKISHANLSKCSCIVFALLSHGGRDNKICALDADYSIFDTIIFKIIKNPTLQGKQKIFLIQACKGTTNPLEFDTDDMLSYGMPDEFLIFFSTFEGYASYLNKNGSIFIRNFCKEFKNDGGRLDIKLIMENTLKIVKEDSGGMQIPSIWGNFTKPYIFGDCVVGNGKKSYKYSLAIDSVGATALKNSKDFNHISRDDCKCDQILDILDDMFTFFDKTLKKSGSEKVAFANIVSRIKQTKVNDERQVAEMLKKDDKESRKPMSCFNNHLKPGKLFIFAHDKSGEKARTEYDVNLLIRSFEKYNVEGAVFSNLQPHEVMEKVIKISQTDFSKHSCIVMALLTIDVHSNCNAYNGIDLSDDSDLDEDLELSIYEKIFISILKNKSLQGKPKIFILDVECRAMMPLNVMSLIQRPSDEIIMLFSRFEGYTSFRNEKARNSLCIKTFCNLLYEHGETMHIAKIMQKTVEETKKMTANFQIPTILDTITIPYCFGDFH